MPAGAMLLVMERLLDPENPSIEATLSDLSMLLMNGGCERSRAEFDVLIAAAGFTLTRVVATQTPRHILESVAIYGRARPCASLFPELLAGEPGAFGERGELEVGDARVRVVEARG